MKLELDSGALHLADRQTLKLLDAAGSTVCARTGTLWITEEKGREDVVLEPGGCFRLGRPGVALVQAFGNASVSFA